MKSGCGNKEGLTFTACNGTIVTDSEMGEVIQLQGDQRKDVQEFLVAKDGLELDAKTIKVSNASIYRIILVLIPPGPWLLASSVSAMRFIAST